MSEKDLQNSIRLFLSDNGFVPFRANVGRFQTTDGRWVDIGLPRGFSDIFAIKDGRAYFFEVKVKPNNPTQSQLVFIEQMQRNGCVAAVVYSIDDVQQAIAPSTTANALRRKLNKPCDDCNLTYSSYCVPCEFAVFGIGLVDEKSTPGEVEKAKFEFNKIREDMKESKTKSEVENG